MNGRWSGRSASARRAPTARARRADRGGAAATGRDREGTLSQRTNPCPGQGFASRCAAPKRRKLGLGVGGDVQWRISVAQPPGPARLTPSPAWWCGGSEMGSRPRMGIRPSSALAAAA